MFNICGSALPLVGCCHCKLLLIDYSISGSMEEKVKHGKHGKQLFRICIANCIRCSSLNIDIVQDDPAVVLTDLKKSQKIPDCLPACWVASSFC